MKVLYQTCEQLVCTGSEVSEILRSKSYFPKSYKTSKFIVESLGWTEKCSSIIYNEVIWAQVLHFDIFNGTIMSRKKKN